MHSVLVVEWRLMPVLTFQSELFWVNVANVALGLVTGVCALMVIWAVFDELLTRRKKRAAYMAEIERELGAGGGLGPSMEVACVVGVGAGTTVSNRALRPRPSMTTAGPAQWKPPARRQ